MSVSSELLESDYDSAALLINCQLNSVLRQNRVATLNRKMINVMALLGSVTDKIGRKSAAYLKASWPTRFEIA